VAPGESSAIIDHYNTCRLLGLFATLRLCVEILSFFFFVSARRWISGEFLTGRGADDPPLQGDEQESSACAAQPCPGNMATCS
jgi:hypothetical protein